MATFSNPPEGFYDEPSGRSPRSYRHAQPQLGRNNARPMDGGFGSMHGSIFNHDNPGAGLRFGGNTFGGPMQNGLQGGHMGSAHFPYDNSAAQTWNASTNNMGAFGGGVGGLAQDPARSVRPSRGRVGLSNLWDDQQYPMQQQPLPNSSAGRQSSVAGRQEPSQGVPDDDELIPTAIVIKNIPFAVKKEQLVDLMVNMNLPLPYAFNYHFDNGVFRGLAFANFTNPAETEQVIQALNHMDLSGRKLRVEYKKMLPLAERERIERVKRERRGQLEEQHRPIVPGQLHSQVSLSALSQARNTPSPLSHRGAPRPGADWDMNDPVTLDFYTKLTIFKTTPEPETLIFPQDLSPEHRRLVHTLAHHMGLLHTSHGAGEQRQVHVQRPAPGTNLSPTNTMSNVFGNKEGMRQNMARSSNADFQDGRQFDVPAYSTLRGQASVGLLDVGENSAFGNAASNNLRNAKSFADLRSWGPSPAPSAASFPNPTQANGGRLQSLNDTTGSNTPTLTPTASNPSLGMGREDSFLISGLNGMSLANGSGNPTSPRRQRSFFTGTTTWEEPSSYQATAPIGSKRAVSMNADNSAPMRQSRGPASNNTIGFRHRGGRGSDELRTPASAIAE